MPFALAIARSMITSPAHWSSLNDCDSATHPMRNDAPVSSVRASAASTLLGLGVVPCCSSAFIVNPFMKSRYRAVGENEGKTDDVRGRTRTNTRERSSNEIAASG